MESISISSTRRTATGKESGRKLRAAGYMPANVYGHGIAEAFSITVEPKELLKVFNSPKGVNALVELQVEGGESYKVLTRDVQRHPVTRKVLHVDFISPDPAKKIVVSVPLRADGRSPGVALGGRIAMPFRDLKVTVLPDRIPAELVADVSALEVGDSIWASALPLPEGSAVVTDRDFVVVRCVQPRGAKPEESDGAEDEAAEAAD